MRGLIRRVLAPAVRQRLRRGIGKAAHWGGRNHCPVCRANLRGFSPDPRTGRPDAMCPVCGAMERHRFIWRYLEEETPLGRAELRVLHAAPETCFEQRIRALPGVAYVTMDLEREDVMVKADLQKLDFEDGAFDLVICNHVLEHVADDRAAMRETFRVLGPGGRAIVSVPGPDPAVGFPRELERTVEDPAVRTPEQRRRRYGHPGHVRQYGRDLAERLRAVGYRVRFTAYGADFDPTEKARLGVYDSYPIYDCTRP
jgi:SAM-dependent methyltransferase